MQRIILKKKKDAFVRRFHPWIFSGAVQRKSDDLTDGEVVEVYTKGGEYLATGHYQDGSICVRIFSFEQVEPNADFWLKKLQNAYDYRVQLDLVDNAETNCYRLVHAEGDGLPGLIIDVYGTAAVVQCHSIGMHGEREHLAAALQQIYGDRLTTIYDKSREVLPPNYARGMENSYLLGESASTIVLENGNRFAINWETGQKTGFFLDQRDNRELLKRYAKGKSVLNTFCYSGGFSIYGLQAGATEVHSVDVSQKAMDLVAENVSLNGGRLVPQPLRETLLSVNQEEQRQTGMSVLHTADVLKFFKTHEQDHDIVIVDPPAFAKNVSKRHNAVQGYKRLNISALKRIKKGGLLFTFSCSQVVGKDLFYNTIVAAAIEAGRKVRVMHHLTQPADHPVSLFHVEGAYLKGLVLQVE
ncbi:MAG: class I SAM-dependent rRNA methyltransferase [Saprospiraceae bacterium]